MSFLSQREYDVILKEIQRDNASKERKRKLKEEKNKYKPKFKLPSTTKLMAFYLFAVLNIVLIYAMVVMYKFRDLSYLGVLITDIAAQVLVFFIHALKSKAENTTGGIIYETAIRQMESSSCNYTESDPELTEPDAQDESDFTNGVG